MINKVGPKKKIYIQKMFCNGSKKESLPDPIHPQHKKKKRKKKEKIHFISCCVVLVVVFLVPTSKLLLTEPNPRLNKS